MTDSTKDDINIKDNKVNKDGLTVIQEIELSKGEVHILDERIMKSWKLAVENYMMLADRLSHDRTNPTKPKKLKDIKSIDPTSQSTFQGGVNTTKGRFLTKTETISGGLSAISGFLPGVNALQKHSKQGGGGVNIEKGKIAVIITVIFGLIYKAVLALIAVTTSASALLTFIGANQWLIMILAGAYFIKSLRGDNKKEISKRQLSHVYYDADPNEISYALLTNSYFKLHDTFYNKGEQGNTILLNNIFEEWYKGKSNKEYNSLRTYINLYTNYNKLGLAANTATLDSDISNIFGQSPSSLLGSIKDKEGDWLYKALKAYSGDTDRDGDPIEDLVQMKDKLDQEGRNYYIDKTKDEFEPPLESLSDVEAAWLIEKKNHTKQVAIARRDRDLDVDPSDRYNILNKLILNEKSKKTEYNTSITSIKNGYAGAKEKSKGLNPTKTKDVNVNNLETLMANFNQNAVDILTVDGSGTYSAIEAKVIYDALSNYDKLPNSVLPIKTNTEGRPEIMLDWNELETLAEDSPSSRYHLKEYFYAPSVPADRADITEAECGASRLLRVVADARERGVPPASAQGVPLSGKLIDLIESLPAAGCYDITETMLFRHYIAFIFYRNVLKILSEKRTQLLLKVNQLVQSDESAKNILVTIGGRLSTNFKSKILRDKKADYKKWLKKRQLEEFIIILESKKVRGNEEVLESLRTLNSRPEAKKLVIKGAKSISVERLEKAIKELNDDKGEDDKKQAKKEEEGKKSRAEKEELKKQEDKKKADKILELRKKMEEENKEKDAKQKEKVEIDDKPVPELKKDEKVVKPDDKKVVPKKKSLWETIFGETTESVLKKGSYIPPDKRFLKIAEEELEMYKNSRDELNKEIKLKQLRKIDEVNFLKKQVNDRLKELEYRDRNHADKIKASHRSMMNMKYVLEGSVKDQFKIIEENNKLAHKKYKQDIHELDILYEKYINKVNTESKLRFNNQKYNFLLELLDDYKGSSEVVFKLKQLLENGKVFHINDKFRDRLINDLTKRKHRVGGIRTKRKNKMKLKDPSRGVYSIKEFMSR